MPAVPVDPDPVLPLALLVVVVTATSLQLLSRGEMRRQAREAFAQLASLLDLAAEGLSTPV